MKRTIRRAARALGYDFRKIVDFNTPSLADFLSSRGIDLVLDVGANVGQFAIGIRAKGYSGDIISFEPIASEFRELKERAKGDRRWDVRNLALGEKSGCATINVSERTVFSSFLPQTSTARYADESAAVTRVEEVDVARLDEIFDPFRQRNVFLKIDTQGYERPVLEGAARILTHLKGIQLELPIVHLYQRTWHLDEAIGYMRERRFFLSQITPVGFHWEDRASLLEVDCVFRRAYADER